MVLMSSLQGLGDLFLVLSDQGWVPLVLPIRDIEEPGFHVGGEELV